MSRASQRLRRVFERRYHVAFVLLALAATAGFVASYQLTNAETDRAGVVILATEQRALSQRVAFLIKAIDQVTEPARADELRAELDAAIARMHRAHSILSGEARESRSLARFINPLSDIYATGYIPFDNKVRQFLENARIIAATSPYSAEWELAAPLRDEIVLSATSSMMQTHGLMVMILEAEANRDVALSKTVDIVSWLSILALLSLVTLVIFRPMRIEITRAFEEVEGAQTRASEAEAQATAATQARGHFFQAASHELRTPLNAILGMSDVIKTKSTPEIEKEIEQISAAGDHLLSLLNNILDAHRMAEGRLSMEEKPFPLRQTITRVLGLAESMAIQKNIGFKADVDVPASLVVEGDASRLEQVLVNLLDNATKFTDKGEVSVHAHVEETNPSRTNLYVAVSDTGIGIAPDRIQSIFDRHAVDATSLARNGGLGVGLSVAKELIELMGGSISVDSKPGKGSRFVVSLPFTVDTSAIIRTDEITDVSDDDMPILRASARRQFEALIVDDNMANRMVAEALLKPLGATTQMAVDGRQAVTKAEKHKFDVIFMDISMPVMDGIEATIAIREGSGVNKDTPIVALTAHVNTGEFETLRVHGFQDIITKPVRKDTLARALDRWLPLRDAPSETEKVA